MAFENGEIRPINVQGTVRVLEAARAAGAENLLYAASSSCYGLADVPTREDHPIVPKYPYALSKYQGEQAAFHWHQVYKLPVNAIRIFNAYGTRSRTSGAYGAVFGVFLRQKIAGKPFGSKEPYGIGLPLDSDGVAFVNDFLKKIEDDGTWTELWQICIGDRTGDTNVPELPEIGA